MLDNSLGHTAGASVARLTPRESERVSTENDFQVRRRLQKLRWLGLEDEADRLAAQLPPSRCALRPRLAIDEPDTD